MLCLLQRIPVFKQLALEVNKLKQRAEGCSRQLKGWAQSLQNSDYKGERHVNQKIKRIEQAAREREEFLKELAEVRAKAAAAKASNP
jgi:hypothetical protein